MQTVLPWIIMLLVKVSAANLFHRDFSFFSKGHGLVDETSDNTL